MKLAPYVTSPLASASGLPCSAVMMRARSSACWCSRPNHFIITAARSLAVLARHSGQARSAAAMAASVSAAPSNATSASFRPVAGSCTSKRALPATHSPPISASVFSSVGSFSVARGEVDMSIAGLLAVFGSL